MSRGSDVVIVFRQLDAWPGERRKSRDRSPFSARFESTWSMLQAELSHLRCREAMILCDAPASAFRIDGRLRDDASILSPGIVLVCPATRNGPLKFPCDRYVEWQANVRAIAMSLEALRAVDRHGVTRHAEQYRGWSQLPPSRGPIVAGEWSSAEDAARFLLRTGGSDDTDSAKVLAVLNGWLDLAYRDAMKRAHPDAGGTDELAQRVGRAKAFIVESRAVSTDS